MRIRAKITTKGQTTVPAEVRSFLNLEYGDQFEYVLEGDRVYLSPKNLKLAGLAGLLGTPPNGKQATLDDMDSTIAQSASEEAMGVLNDRARHKRPDPIHRRG